jgi:hypothetical protein
MTCLHWKSVACRQSSARCQWEREFAANGICGVTKALRNIDHCDLTGAPFLFSIADFRFSILMFARIPRTVSRQPKSEIEHARNSRP